MKNIVKILFYLSIFCTIIIVLIVNFNIFSTKSNGFRRKFIRPEVRLERVLELPNQSFDFVDKPDSSIILRNYRHPSLVYNLDFSFKSMKPSFHHIAKQFNSKSKVIFMSRYTNLLLMTNVEGDISLLNKDFAQYFKYTELSIDQSQLLTKSSIVARSLQINTKASKERALSKLILTNKVVRSIKFILPTQVDGYFCTDGWLNYDKKQLKLIYMYYYRGQFLCLDTNLKLVFKAKTIDTITTARIKLAETSTKLDDKKIKKVTVTNSNSVVNRAFTIDENNIYIISEMKSDNEDMKTFNSNLPTDVYSLQNGNYLYSFHIPKFKNLRISEFEIKGNSIIAIYNKFIVLYSFKKINKF